MYRLWVLYKVLVENDVKTETFWEEVKSIIPLSTKLYLSDLKTQFIPSSKHSASVLKTDNLILYREIIAVCSEIHAKHINTL